MVRVSDARTMRQQDGGPPWTTLRLAKRAATADRTLFTKNGRAERRRRANHPASRSSLQRRPSKNFSDELKWRACSFAYLCPAPAPVPAVCLPLAAAAPVSHRHRAASSCSGGKRQESPSAGMEWDAEETAGFGFSRFCLMSIDAQLESVHMACVPRSEDGMPCNEARRQGSEGRWFERAVQKAGLGAVCSVPQILRGRHRPPGEKGGRRSQQRCSGGGSTSPAAGGAGA